jgi:hypothetical protein
MVIVDGEEWIVHPKVKEKEEPEAGYCRGSFGGCKYDCLYDPTLFSRNAANFFRKIVFLLRLIPLCSILKDRRTATGIVAILHLTSLVV